jgi:hypothetical protein
MADDRMEVDDKIPNISISSSIQRTLPNNSGIDRNEIVSEMDLYLNSKSSKSLYLLQYLTKVWARVPEDEISSMQVKPRHLKLEMTLEPHGFDENNPDRFDSTWKSENSAVQDSAIKLTSKLVPLNTNCFTLIRNQSMLGPLISFFI